MPVTYKSAAKEEGLRADVRVYFCREGKVAALIKTIEPLCPQAEQLLQDQQFTGKKGQTALLHSGNEVYRYLIVAGLGSEREGRLALEQYRRALGSVVRVAERYNLKSCVIGIPNHAWFESSADQLLAESATIVSMANHLFDTFLSAEDRKEKALEVTFLSSGKETALQQGIIIADAVNQARQWVDLPSNHLTPTQLADEAKQIADQFNLACTIFNEEQVKEKGMGGVAFVSRGSDEECRFVVLEYDCGNAHAPTIALVGKGIMFDTGGISLKPPAYMETMKEDMAGAAAMIATMKVIAQLKPKVNVVSVTPLAENLPSGKAGRPGDIIRFYNGKTADVKNTDAEGRLVLADALAYAEKHYEPTAIIDAATLTGACEHALGQFFSAMLSEHDELATRVAFAANESGEYVWRLPLTDDYKVAMKSVVADVCNIASRRYKAGTINAAVFLQHFVEKTPWVHLDIAGTAFDVPNISYYRPESATGVGVRLLVNLLMNW